MSKSLTIIRWTPRILCILAVLFVSLFAFDSFDPRLTFAQQLGGFFIHLIPSFVLLILLLIAWRWELAGGILLATLALGFAVPIFFGNYRNNHSVWISLGIIMAINLPFILAGALFIISHFVRKKHASATP